MTDRHATASRTPRAYRGVRAPKVIPRHQSSRHSTASLTQAKLCRPQLETTTGAGLKEGVRASDSIVTIYLDQAKSGSIGGRAWTDDREANASEQALDVARNCVVKELVEFPLSVGHYIETWRSGNRAATTLARDDAPHSRADGRWRVRRIWRNNELDAVISRLAELRICLALRTRALGWGFAHASGLNPAVPRTTLDLALELEHLANRPSGFGDYGRGHRELGDLYRHGEQVLAAGQQRDARSPEMERGGARCQCRAGDMGKHRLGAEGSRAAPRRTGADRPGPPETHHKRTAVRCS